MPELTIPAAKYRIHSIDILRGIIMIVMALDHARDFFHANAVLQEPTDLSTTYPLLFFTRIITHYCAASFVFLSGISAFIAGQKKTPKQRSLFLIKRGLWLVVVELVAVNLITSFDPLYHLIVLQVIWAIGISMIILGLLVRTSVKTIVIIGSLLLVGHNLFDLVKLPATGAPGILLNFLFTANGFGNMLPLGNGYTLMLAYAILPWTAIMLLGYGLGTLFTAKTDPQKRVRILTGTGLLVIALFIVLRLLNIYGDPAPWSHQKNGIFTFLSFVNVSKYPPSLLYACMTLGPSILLLGLLERTKNKFTDIVSIYGRVPFFYYVCHFFLIHLICVILFFATGHGSKEIVTDTGWYFRPVHFGFHLWVVYLLWLTVVVLLYLPCQWFDRYKKTHTQWWLSYL